MKKVKPFVGIVALLLWAMLATSALPSASTAGYAPHAISDSKEFYLVYTDNYDDGQGADLFITSYNSTYGVVEIPGIGFSREFTVAADTVTTIRIPLAAEVQDSDVIDDLGIHITANDDITTYFLNPGVPVFTNDAYVGLPVQSLGSEYLIMAWPNTLPARANSNVGQSELAIVSPFNNVSVTITPSITTGSRSAGVPYTIVLDQFQTYTLQSDDAFEDLTGTLVQSSQPVAVFSGNRCADIPAGYGYCDHVIEQMTPVSAWGNNFVTIPLESRANGDFIRVLAAEDGTTVTVSGSIVTTGVVPRTVAGGGLTHGVGVAGALRLPTLPVAVDDLTVTLDRTAFAEFRATGPIAITTDKPVLVGQFGTGSDYGGNPGDPLLMLIPPSEQFLLKYTFLVPTGYDANFITIIAPDDATSSVRLDGANVPAGQFASIGQGLSGATVDVSEGSHTLIGGKPLGVYVYGFGYDVSYGYPGGLDARVLNPPDGDDLTPVIIVPGLGGTRLSNDDGEIWLDVHRLVNDAVRGLGKPGNDYFDVLRLNDEGTGPLEPNNDAYTSVRADSVLTGIHETVADLPDWLPGAPNEIRVDSVFYQDLVDHFQAQGYELNTNLFLFPYDWRYDLAKTTAQLDTLIDTTRGDGQVNVVAHSMGGLVTRRYIMDSARAAKVNSVAILGTPFLGAPYAFKAIYLGDDFGINSMAHDAGVPDSMWLVNEGKVKELAQNFPGVYQILPSRRFFDVYEGGYLVEDRDLDGQGGAAGQLRTYDGTKKLLSNLLNDNLLPKAEALHSTAFDGFVSATSDVEVCLFVGAGQATKERIRFWETTNFWLFKEDHASWLYGNGDGTVLLHSADLQDEDSDFQGSAHVYYANTDHQGLIHSVDVRQQVTRCFDGNYEPVNDKISISPDTWSVNGEWIEVNSPVELHIYDSLGNHLGPSLVDGVDGEVIEYGIPNAQYVVTGHDKSAFVPAGIEYHVVLIGTDEGAFDLRLRSVVDDVVQQTVLYDEVTVETESVANVSLASGSTYMMAMDEDGDGSADYTVPPTATLDSEESTDIEPPHSTIVVVGQTDTLGFYSGWVTVTITAADNPGGAGVREILYALDGGQTVHVYVGPLTVNSNQVSIIYAKAIDHAGNEEGTLQVKRLTPFRLYVPTIRDR